MNISPEYSATATEWHPSPFLFPRPDGQAHKKGPYLTTGPSNNLQSIILLPYRARLASDNLSRGQRYSFCCKPARKKRILPPKKPKNAAFGSHHASQTMRPRTKFCEIYINPPEFPSLFWQGILKFVSLHKTRCALSSHIESKEALCLLLVSEKPRKLKSREQEMADGSRIRVGL